MPSALAGGNASLGEEVRSKLITEHNGKDITFIVGKKKKKKKNTDIEENMIGLFQVSSQGLHIST